MPAYALKRLNIEEVARDVVDTLEPIAQDKNVSLSIEGAAPDILANEDRLKQALINLVDNAIRHVEEGGHVRILLSGVNDNSVVALKTMAAVSGILIRYFFLNASTAAIYPAHVTAAEQD